MSEKYKEGLTKCTRCAKVLEVDWLMGLCSMCRIKKLETKLKETEIKLSVATAEMMGYDDMLDAYEVLQLENKELKKQLEDHNTKLSKLSYSTLNAITRDIEEYDEIN